MVSINSHFTTLETLLRRECVSDFNGRYNYNEVFGCRFMQWNRKYLSFDQSRGWSIVQLNLIDRIFRYLFGSHPTTHLTFIANHITSIRTRITNENQMEAQFLDRMHSCWTRANPTANMTRSPFMYHVILPALPPREVVHPRETLLPREATLAPSDESDESDQSDQIASSIKTLSSQEDTPELTTEDEIRQLIAFGLTDDDIHEFLQSPSRPRIEIQQVINRTRTLSPTIDKELYDLIDELVQDSMSDEEIILLMQGSNHSNADILNYIERAKVSHANNQSLIPEVPPIPRAGDLIDISPSLVRVSEPQIPMATENEILATIIECVKSEIPDEDIQECLFASGYSREFVQRLIVRAKNQITSTRVLPTAQVQRANVQLANVQATNDSSLILAANGVNQYQLGNIAACTRLACAFLSSDKPASPQLIQELIQRNSHFDATFEDTEMVIQAFPNLRLARNPLTSQAFSMTLQVAYDRERLQSALEALVHSQEVSGSIITANSLTIAMRKKPGKIEFLDSHGDDSVTKAGNTAYIKTFKTHELDRAAQFLFTKFPDFGYMGNLSIIEMWPIGLQQ